MRWSGSAVLESSVPFSQEAHAGPRGTGQIQSNLQLYFFREYNCIAAQEEIIFSLRIQTWLKHWDGIGCAYWFPLMGHEFILARIDFSTVFSAINHGFLQEQLRRFGLGRHYVGVVLLLSPGLVKTNAPTLWSSFRVQSLHSCLTSTWNPSGGSSINMW